MPGTKRTREDAERLLTYPSLPAAAKAEGISKQRVHQILNRYGLQSPSKWKVLCVGSTFHTGQEVLAVRERDGKVEYQLRCKCSRVFWTRPLESRCCGKCTHAERIAGGKDPMVGRQNDRLVCLKRLPGGKVLVRCACGVEKVILSNNFRYTRSCGCLTKEYLQRRRLEVDG